jgi:hypothetical protein
MFDNKTPAYDADWMIAQVHLIDNYIYLHQFKTITEAKQWSVVPQNNRYSALVLIRVSTSEMMLL